MVNLSEHLLKLATFNIRYAPYQPTSSLRSEQIHLSTAGGTGEAPWSSRLPLIVDQVKWEMPDIIAFQEALEHQYNDLKDLLFDDYSAIGVGRDDGDRRGEFLPLFWRSDKFTSLEVNHFWLSETPHVPGSIGWDAGQTRMVTLVHFQPIITSNDHHPVPASDRSFYVMNTHFDERGYNSRTESAKLILKKANELMKETGRPVVLMGDFNAPSTEVAYQVLTGSKVQDKGAGCGINRPLIIPQDSQTKLLFKDSRHQVDRKYGSYEATFTGFDGNSNVAQVIDYILFLTSPADTHRWKTLAYGVIPNQFSPRQPLASDHRLVCALVHTAFTPSPPP